ncbi:acetyl esterase/lipase [Saonia flava]|uniref:Acetyl esterase/lipase n=1 Tax=Saonia flava TaxID=523696 RepID=A0A846QUU1_9FLAO|nr:alpha/beta hydrolase [Saonia flava]NJB70322.1 acetyl esterase/lipase [Saonia flava]
MNRKIVAFLAFLATINSIMAQDTIMPLWENKIPNQVKSNEVEHHEKNDILWITNVQNPTLEVYLPAKKNANGKAVLIFPGGGYHGLAYDWEGTDIAKLLNTKGIAGIVVKYRLPISKSLFDSKNVPLQDAQRSIRLVRYNADKWNIDPGKIGIIGFSAGGHLASTLGTHYDENVYAKNGEEDVLSARPDFMALIYPVITFDGKVTHGGSKSALIGEQPSQEDVDYFSNELRVGPNTPPTFLVHAVDDDAVPVENSLLFFKALKEHKVSTTLHVYPNGGHGFSLALDDNHLKGWVDRLLDWIASLD